MRIDSGPCCASGAREGATRSAILFLAVLGLQGCRSPGPSANLHRSELGPDAEPVLVAVDSVRLAGADTLPLAEINALTVDPHDGSFYVTDAAARRAYRFAREGNLAGSYGDDTGEDGDARYHDLLVLDRGRVAVLSAGDPDRILVFDRSRFGLRRTVRLPGGGRIGRWTRTNGSVWIHRLAPDSGLGLARWNAEVGEVELLGPVPGPYRRSLASSRASFAGFYGHGAVAPWRDRILHGWSGTDWLYAHRGGGSVVDSVWLPSARRTALVDSLRRRLDGGDVPGVERFALGAMLIDLARFDGGRTAAVHWDRSGEVEGRGSPGSPEGWVSILGTDLERACLDRPLPSAGAIRPVGLAFRGDTVFHLVRRPGAAPGPAPLETWIRLMEVRTERCDWRPTRGAF